MMEANNLDYLPVMPQSKELGIGICGAGGIVSDAHLPAYRKAGFKVAGIYDVDFDKAAKVAKQFEVPKVHESLDELIGDQDVDVIDAAVPATENLGIVKAIAGTGKPILIQKPLAEDYDTAAQTVEVIEASGITAAVNQQMRWEPGVRASKTLLDRGDLGELFNIAMLTFVHTPWHLWEWLKRKKTIDVLYHSIHTIDSIRYLTGVEPLAVYCDGSRGPGYDAVGETRLCLNLVFPGELRATILTNHHAAYGLKGQQAELRVEGTEGVAIRRLGLLLNYPEGVPDEFRYTIRGEGPGGGWRTAEFAQSWYPDAFVGTMSSLMRAVNGEIDRPETDVRDNLKTLKVVFAAYESMCESRVVRTGS